MCDLVLWLRLIPARAGNTSSTGGAKPQCSAHPRSRGEHVVHGRRQTSVLGSSPLARGTPIATVPDVEVARLIPARAGNTRYSAHRLLAHTAHPRSRGEHCRHIQDQPGRCGSSPLARGTPIEQLEEVVEVRLIPARAGNTMVNAAIARCQSAHPRSRGEHSIRSRSRSFFPGSSPLARGTHGGQGVGKTTWRLIPARAGNTCRIFSPLNSKGAHPRSRGEH